MEMRQKLHQKVSKKISPGFFLINLKFKNPLADPRRVRVEQRRVQVHGTARRHQGRSARRAMVSLFFVEKFQKQIFF
jgi:hypothetical protein